MSEMTWGRIGLGCWQLGDDCWGDVSEESAAAILQEALDGGVNFLDTADVYGGGLSESRIGAFLRSASKKPFVATKIGRGGNPGWPGNFEKEAMRAHVLASAARLSVESLDLVQLHCIPTEVLAQGEVFDHLRSFQDDGIIKSWGVSVESVEEGLLCLTQPGLSALQVIFNILRQKPGKVLIPRAHQMGVKIIVRLPFASGVLTGKFTENTTFSGNDHRRFNADGQAFHVGETFNGLPFPVAVRLSESLKRDLPEGMTLQQAALRWILDYPGVSTIIPGASKPGQASQNLAALSLQPLSSDQHEKWAEVYEKEAAPHLRGSI